MGAITAIEAQKRRGYRRSIFVDGEFLVGVHEDVVIALGLGVGQSFDEDRLVEILRAEDLRKARESAYRLLGYRDRSKAEVRKRLIAKDYPEDIVEEVIEQLSGGGLLDDGKFSRDWVKSRTAAKPMGKTRLAWELRSKGVDASTVEEALEGLDEDTQLQLAISVAEKRLGKADRGDPNLKNRLSSLLRRRGFGWEVINKAIDELLQE
ncbi:MAG: RecX family transcriptional regulator [Armatimonadota bacterium]|nr:RecX family transcriptional regulator [bacterium]